ncbi:hypothetical protein HF888_15700 [Bermanella marisrubri]|uniref:LPS-assembly lipoprotein LptE n=1 Tax=Bermanella marisrubri TaxID=207949 RepID=Q1MZJ1_9GAMM|nr:LPS assembly lipoprotein LptE [Bermanella marisrubri]EAT11420.1 leucyl-tRNA synthetase [Oceanobacter sp. RED65] [Bermanella marisrubri]QIZ85583.1 hypothetical protein HF888_15700 [Bermanella marisrubri]
MAKAWQTARLTLTLMLSLAMLTACGWQLRGQVNLPAPLKILSIENGGVDNVTFNYVQQALLSNGVTLSDDADYLLSLENENNSRRVLAVTSNAKASEYELKQTLTARISKDNWQQTIEVSSYRTQLYDAAAEIGKAQEAAELRADMRRDNANRLLRRLQNLKLEP